uniref:t-SNARE coiled-coil homology domain-containing protein n=1 Tax=Dendroctonus ponderosae TaxID=77166 RepID=J3JZE0_DENPD|nr:unknown [Dendroctonus ponderosae]
MARDRLQELRHKATNQGTGAAPSDEEAQPLTAPDLLATLEWAEVLRQWVETIEANVDALRAYLRKVEDFDTDQRALNEKIDALFQANASIAQRVQAKLRSFEAQLGDVQSAAGRIQHIQYNTLKARFQVAFAQSNAQLEELRNVKKAQLEAQLRAKGVRISELDQLLQDGGDLQVFTENILAETAEAKRVLQDLEDRHQQLLKIERMLADVRDLFLQMSILIDDQQEVIDRVEYQAELAQDFVGRGRDDLKKGREKRSKYLKTKIILMVALVLLTIIILALIFK